MLGKYAYALLTVSLALFGGLMFVANNAFAQNVSVTDYEIPVSAADRLLVDFAMNHATSGSTATTSKGNIGGIYKRFYDSLPFGYSIDIIGSGLVDKNIETDEYENNYQVNGMPASKNT